MQFDKFRPRKKLTGRVMQKKLANIQIKRTKRLGHGMTAILEEQTFQRKSRTILINKQKTLHKAAKANIHVEGGSLAEAPVS
jgi:hypothetical protein